MCICEQRNQRQSKILCCRNSLRNWNFIMACNTFQSRFSTRRAKSSKSNKSIFILFSFFHLNFYSFHKGKRNKKEIKIKRKFCNLSVNSCYWTYGNLFSEWFTKSKIYERKTYKGAAIKLFFILNRSNKTKNVKKEKNSFV